MGGALTATAITETMSLTGASGATAATGGITTALGTAATAVSESVSALGSYTIAIGSYTMAVPVVAIAFVGVVLAGMASWVLARRARGGEEAQRLLGGSYGSDLV